MNSKYPSINSVDITLEFHSHKQLCIKNKIFGTTKIVLQYTQEDLTVTRLPLDWYIQLHFGISNTVISNTMDVSNWFVSPNHLSFKYAQILWYLEVFKQFHLVWDNEVRLYSKWFPKIHVYYGVFKANIQISKVLHVYCWITRPSILIEYQYIH